MFAARVSGLASGLALAVRSAGASWPPLRRKHIDTTAGLIRIEVAVVELTNGALVTGAPESASGIRWVSIPAFSAAGCH